MKPILGGKSLEHPPKNCLQEHLVMKLHNFNIEVFQTSFLGSGRALGGFPLHPQRCAPAPTLAPPIPVPRAARILHPPNPLSAPLHSLRAAQPLWGQPLRKRWGIASWRFPYRAVAAIDVERRTHATSESRGSHRNQRTTYVRGASAKATP